MMNDDQWKAVRATHRWRILGMYAGAMSRGPSPPNPMLPAVLYECVLCGDQTVDALEDESPEVQADLEARSSDAHHSIYVDRIFRGEICKRAAWGSA
jgi:hypothetical protein